MDEATEVAEGAKGHQGVLKEYGAYNNAAMQTYVNTLVLHVVLPFAGTDAATIICNVIKPTQGRTEAVTFNDLSAMRFVGRRQNAHGQSRPLRPPSSTAQALPTT